MSRVPLLAIFLLGCTPVVPTEPVEIADADGDGVADADDVCPDADDTLDADADGLPDGCDPCPTDPLNDGDADGVCDSSDICLEGDDFRDEDGDTVPDACDVCPGFNDFGPDGDEDGVPNECDVCPYDNPDDSDGDGICDSDDRCEGFDDNEDADGDTQPDGCDPCPDDNPNDTDGDGQCEGVDPCPLDPDDDSDGDGTCDSDDICPGSDDYVDEDGDGYPDGCDPCLGDPLNSCGWYCTLDMDDAWTIYGENASPEAHYGPFGVSFNNNAGYGLIGGMGNGDPGNWDIEGTNGSAAWGIWPGYHDIQFAQQVTDTSLDFLRGHYDYSITVEAYLLGQLVDSQQLSMVGAFDFETATFVGPIDEIRFDTVDYFGVDNVNYFTTMMCP